jgi:hypothetical protein
LKVASDAERALARKRVLESSVKKLAESERQSAECDAMWEAEKEIRKVYRYELRKCLAERRAMKAEEATMREYEVERKLAEALQANNKYSLKGVKAADDEEGEGMLSAKEKRRLEVKQGGVDKQRLKKERDAMLVEDKLSLAMRVEELKQIQLAILKSQMALMGAPGDDDEDDDGEDDDQQQNEDLDPEQRAKLKREKEVSLLLFCIVSMSVALLPHSPFSLCSF